MIGIILENTNKKSLYVFKTLFGIMGFEYYFINEKDAESYPGVVYYGNNPNLKSKYAIEIPVSGDFIGKIGKSPYTRSNGKIIFNIDIVSLSFFLLARQEEMDNKSRDMHKRFDHSETILKDFIKEPIINNYIRHLEELIIEEFRKQNLPLLKKAYWPCAEDFAASLTHDVDVLYKYNFIGSLVQAKKILVLFLKLKLKLSFSSAYTMIQCIITNKKPYWQMLNVADFEKKYGFVSSFYLCAKRRHKLDPYYDVRSDEIKNAIRKLHSMGFEIGVHGSYTSYLDFEKLREEKEILEKALNGKVTGNRQHFGRFEAPYTWRLHNKLFAYDSTVGYINMSGFRASICFPFIAYDALEDKELDLIEVPFTTSDGTLFGPMNLSKEDAWKDTEKLIDKIRENNGLIVLDWHQRVIYEEDYPGYWWVYAKAVERIKELKAYVAPLGEITEWWAARGNLIVKSGKKNKSYEISSKKELKNASFLLYNADKFKIEGNSKYDAIKKDGCFLIKFEMLKDAVIKID